MLIAQGEEALVTCMDETRHGLEDGDFVTFTEIKGMEGLNSAEPRKVTTRGEWQFCCDYEPDPCRTVYLLYRQHRRSRSIQDWRHLHPGQDAKDPAIRQLAELASSSKMTADSVAKLARYVDDS